MHKEEDYWPVVNQNPPTDLHFKLTAENAYLPTLKEVWKEIERVTGYRWRCTSYWRNSPSHRKGYALDIAPDISDRSERYYAVSHNSDPVLYKRVKLIRRLQQVAREYKSDQFDVGIYIEPDHLHIQLFKPESPIRKTRIFKWKLIKPIYSDSAARSQQPLIMNS